ncbi:TPA: hypothetical protein ACKONR_003160 [Clostridioides difficile]|uniref:hypothetical protein n=1 Tax=Clostridioides difficile TaxID=1496 RepID=UPI00038D3CE7|nr:hypothetical protein [Clostridioides difficile]AXU27639.1 hypothetical protein CDIF102859_01853 [Clostridioides difficile]AXU31437.1 hypothetical protein CDIF102860_01880 [Clostridioides difficile]AXU35225.1 hypothetical protein CDIF102978_01880 [Clostridioides difficile]EQE86018.1 putative exported protein [Clostridioides difficile CD69]MBY1133983.1 hypothetical protein [Clostridioides difficile]
MKLKSKISILIIFLTLAIYFSIGLLNNEDNLKIKTIKGDPNELDYININFGYALNGYINSYYTINGSNKTKKTELIKLQKDSKNTNNLIDVSSGSDLIAHVGFEMNDDSKDINFVIDEKKEDLETGVFPSEGSDKEIEYEKLDMNNFTRTRYKVDKSTDDYYANILSSKRYKKYLYVSVLYATSDSSENNKEYSTTIDIIKINPENKKIKTIKSINLSNYFSEKYQNIETIGVSYASKYEDKMYILVNVLNANIDDNSNSKFHLLEYNLEGNKESIMELKTDSKMALAKAKLEDNKLYMVMSNDYDNSSITELNLLTYNILDKSLDEDKYVLDNREKRGIRSIEIDSNKIVAYTSRLNSILSWDNKFMLYIINKNSKEIVYEGELQFNSSNSMLEFEIK